MRSGLARSIHPSHATVRVAALVTIAAGSVAGAITLMDGEAFTEATRNGVLAGGAAFIAWALTREMAPDHPVTAALAGAAAPLLLFAGPADLLSAGLMIFPIRILAGTTGRDLTPLDLAAVAVGAVAVSFRDTGVVVGLVVALSPATSAWWARRSRRGLLIAASGVMIAIVVPLALVVGDHDPWIQPTGFARGLFVGGLAAGLVAAWVVPGVSSSVDSRRGGRVLTHRVRLGRVAALVAAVATALWAGGPGVLALGPVWAALAVTAVSSIATLGRELAE